MQQYPIAKVHPARACLLALVGPSKLPHMFSLRQGTPRGFASQLPFTVVFMSTKIRLLAPPVQQGLVQRCMMHPSLPSRLSSQIGRSVSKNQATPTVSYRRMLKQPDEQPPVPRVVECQRERPLTEAGNTVPLLPSHFTIATRHHCSWACQRSIRWPISTLPRP